MEEKRQGGLVHISVALAEFVARLATERDEPAEHRPKEMDEAETFAGVR